MKTLYSIFAVALIISTGSISSNGQGQYVPASNVLVKEFGTPLANPWAGGFNAPIFSEIDMNGDGIKDLFVFDKDGCLVFRYWSKTKTKPIVRLKIKLNHLDIQFFSPIRSSTLSDSNNNNLTDDVQRGSINGYKND